MSSRMKEDEKHEKIIRSLTKLPENRRCINCNSLGPQYVCSNFSTFVCTTCSGIHREFTHRVKSISMSKFTAADVAILQSGGNERARNVFLKEWNFQRNLLPDSSNVDKLRDFIKNVYVERRYVGGKLSPRARQGGGEDTRDYHGTDSRSHKQSDSLKSTNEIRRSNRPQSDEFNTRRGNEFLDHFNNVVGPRRSDVGGDRQERFYHTDQRRALSSDSSNQMDDSTASETGPRWSVDHCRPRHSVDLFPDEINGQRLSFRRGMSANASTGVFTKGNIHNVPGGTQGSQSHINGHSYVTGLQGPPVGLHKDARVARLSSFGNATSVSRNSAALTRAHSDSLIDFSADPAISAKSNPSDRFGVTLTGELEVASVGNTGWATFDSSPGKTTGAPKFGASSGVNDLNRGQPAVDQVLGGNHGPATSTKDLDGWPAAREQFMDWDPFPQSTSGAQSSHSGLQQELQAQLNSNSSDQTLVHVQQQRSRNPFDLPGDSSSMPTGLFPSMSSLEAALPALTLSSNTVPFPGMVPISTQWSHTLTGQHVASNLPDAMTDGTSFPAPHSLGMVFSTTHVPKAVPGAALGTSGNVANGLEYTPNTTLFDPGKFQNFSHVRLRRTGSNPFD